MRRHLEEPGDWIRDAIAASEKAAAAAAASAEPSAPAAEPSAVASERGEEDEETAR